MKAKQYTTFFADGKSYQREVELSVTEEKDESSLLESFIVNLYPEILYQTIEGFGGAMTEASAYLLSKLDVKTRKSVLERCFSNLGNNYQFVRMPIDSCDFSLSEYQAVENPLDDPELKTFSIKRDMQYMIPMMKEAMAIAGHPLSVLLSPWSPPSCWKTIPSAFRNDGVVYGALPGQAKPSGRQSRCNGGSLKPEYYGAWARYLTKYVQTYLAEGIPVTMLSIQNEAAAATEWDSCVWTAEEEKRFLKDYLYPAWREAGLDGQVGIFFWDHNKERVVERALSMLDEQTDSMLEGIAFHWYTGDHFEALSILRERYPDKILMMSECCVLHAPGRIRQGNPSAIARFRMPDSIEYDDAVQYAHDIIGNLNAGMNRWIDWNLMVDENGGPRHVPNGFAAPIIARGDRTCKYSLTMDYIGHFSRFIRPGARRMAYTRYCDAFELTAARNPNGDYILIGLNRKNEDTGFIIRCAGKVIRVSLPARTISTLVLC